MKSRGDGEQITTTTIGGGVEQHREKWDEVRHKQNINNMTKTTTINNDATLAGRNGDVRRWSEERSSRGERGVRARE